MFLMPVLLPTELLSCLPVTSCVFDSFVAWLLNFLCFHGLLTRPWYVDYEFGTTFSNLMSKSFFLALKQLIFLTSPRLSVMTFLEPTLSSFWLSHYLMCLPLL